MATTLTNSTFSTTYRDDFRDSDNYHRILFNAGRALQARELTQMQTIIQKEIERFGGNIFREGAPVREGNITVNTTYEFVKLNTTLNPLPADLESLIGLELTVEAPNPAIKFRVIDAIPAADGDPATLYVRYTDTTAATPSGDPIRVPNGATFNNGSLDNPLKAASTAATGRGTAASNSDGDYFVQGHFVYARSQTVIISKYTSTPTTDIGFKVVEEVITPVDDVALFDNQGATPNVASPGADRYRIRLTLTTRDEVNSDENFVYLARIVNGRITDTASGDDAYNVINDVMALRTKEESGDYVVKPFIASFDDLNDSNLKVSISSGTAYVDGYRLNIPTTTLTLPKAQDTVEVASQNVIAQYGNYVVGDASDNVDLPNISTFALVNLRSSADYGGSTIGTARVRAIQEDGANHNYYLFDIQMQSGQSFRDTRSFGTGGSNYVNIVLEDGIAQLKSTANNSLLWPLPNQRPSSTGVNITSLTIQKRYTFTTDGSGNANGVAAGSGFTFTDQFQWVVTEESGAIASPTIQLVSGNTQANFSGLSNTTTYVLYAYVIKSTVSSRTKSLNVDEELTVAWPGDAESDGTGTRYIDLGTADIYRIKAIKETDSDGDDISTNFIFDNGQRDNFYAKGRLIERGGVTVPTGDIFVKFDHFTHGASGDFFSVNSYDGVVSYSDIPTHTRSTGEVVNLRDVLDFRPVQDANGNYTGADGVINPLPQNTDAISGTIDYYAPRRDRLVASVTSSRDTRFGRGELQIINGIPSLSPQYPEIPTGAIPLYDINLNPFTLNDSDLSTRLYTNKRFTMKDISNLEKRIDQLQELTTLNLLELSTETLTVLDSAGLSRTKAGFIADNFADYAFSNINGAEYAAAIDPATNLLSPQQFPNSIRLIYDSDDATNTGVRNGDLLMLPHTDVRFVNQDLASGTINVNPYAVITSTGHIDLSPASDAWVETRFAPDRVVDGGTITRVADARRTVNNINTWRNSWFGRALGDAVQVVTGSDVVREIVGERIIDIEIIPFMRSIKVGFRALGLRPNTQYFSFFGESSVADWVREESTFNRFAETTDDFGNSLTGLSGHPDGATDLISNEEGSIVGSFVIPSTDSLRFRTGEQIFKLLDISTNNDANATSSAQATFTSTGVVETVQRTISSTRILQLGWLNQRQEGNGGQRDPIAQSFRIDQVEYPSGIFLTKVRLYFQTKDATVPVQVQIRTMENGVPTGGPIPGATKFLSPSQVFVPNDIDDLNEVRAEPTDFEFDEPVYLAPGQEYAFVVLAESTAYNVYIAKTYDFVLGSTEARISRQPTLGSLFLSQNASTWTPEQTSDIMFQLFRAEFETAGNHLIENASLPLQRLDTNPFLTTNGDSDVRVFHPGHGFILNDKVFISGLNPISSYGGISGANLNGTRTINEVDHTGYKFTAGAAATASIRTGGDGVLVSKNMMFNTYLPAVTTLTPRGTGVSASIKLTTGASFAEPGNRGRNQAVNNAYAKDTNYIPITLNEFNTTTDPKLIASDSNESTSLGGAKSLSMLLALSTTDTRVSPVIDLQRANIVGFENIIDNQDSADTSVFNVPISFVPETHPTDGTSAAKHVTSQITLAQQAVGLKILFAANRPAAAGFRVYIKTSQGDEVLDTIPWVEVQPETNIPADDDGTTFRQYEYLAGGVGGNLLPFSVFQIKIVMTTTNSSRIPRLRDLRAIALAT